MTWLILGLVIFLGIHSVSIVSHGWRDAQVARMGENRWKGLYSLISVASFILLVMGYGIARQSPVVLYNPPMWMRHVTMLLMVPVLPLLLAAYLPGRIKAALKHPFLAAVKLWALAHLLSNGTLADVLLFGGFLAWAVADRISVKSRPEKPAPDAPPRPMNDVIAVVLGLVLYGLFVGRLHLWLFGVSPMG